nr:phage tail protein [uncultured Pseudomonas sp.]
MSLSATLFGRDSAIHRITNILGLGIPSWLDKKFGAPETEGPRLGDLSVQTSTYGAQIPRLYGTISVMGNIIWLENNKLKETVRKKKSGGKGGGGASEPTKTYSYSATFHLGLCEGPIAGIRRMWCGDKLIYNASSDDLETIIASNKAAKGWKLYLGTDSQLPDSRYEADVGVGNASAHRGLAYIAFYDFQLADYSNTLQGAQFKVEVVTAGEMVNVLIDQEIDTIDGFTYASVGRPLEDIYGLELLDNATSIFFDGYASFTRRQFRLGKLTPESDPNVILDIDEFAYPAGIRSYDGRYWWQYKSNVAPIYESYLRSEDGQWITLDSPGFAQGMLNTGYIPFADQYTYAFCYAGDPFQPDIIDRIGWAGTFEGASVPSNVPVYVLQTPGWSVSTDGDEPYEWRIYDDIFSIRIYNSALTLVIKEFSVSLPVGVWPDKIDGNDYQEGSRVCCHLKGRVAYIVTFNGANGYWHAGCAESGVVFYYLIPANSVLSNRIHAIWPYDESQGLIQTNNRIIQWRRYDSGSYPLASIIEEEVAASGLITADDVDTSMILTDVRGYRITGGIIRAALEPLQAAFPFDVRTHGYKIQFLPRGQSSVATIPWDDLGATDGDTPDDILQQSREMDSQLPARTAIKYLDAAREYAISEQYSERLNTEAVNRVDRELPLVLTADEAAGVAEVLNFLPWLERTDFAFKLPPTYRNLEPADVVTISAPQATYELRVTETNETPDGRLECKARPNRAALYTSASTGSEGVPPAGTIGLGGASIFIPLDIPVVDETIQNAVGFVGAMTGETSGWPGALLVRSSDEGQTWADLQAYAGKASIGTAITTLPVSSCTLIDQRTLNIFMISGAPEGVTRDQMLAGSNYAAYGADGRWEIVRFQSAALQVNGTYLLSGFVRGERGTEWATGLHAAGDYFVLLEDPDNAFIGMPVETIGLDRTYRAVTAGDSVDDATDVPFTYRGVNLECLSPVYPKGSRDGSSNFTGTFTRRSRLSSSWWTSGVVAPIGETTESYEIDVMSGSTVVRTIAVSTPSFSYSAANQTTDFGSAQSSITFRIYQLSEVVGRGYPLEVTL